MATPQYEMDTYVDYVFISICFGRFVKSGIPNRNFRFKQKYGINTICTHPAVSIISNLIRVSILQHNIAPRFNRKLLPLGHRLRGCNLEV